MSLKTLVGGNVWSWAVYADVQQHASIKFKPFILLLAVVKTAYCVDIICFENFSFTIHLGCKCV